MISGQIINDFPCVFPCNEESLGALFRYSCYFARYRGQKIEKLCGVMGVEWPCDPDDSYELTTDNLKKILAIHMRFRYDSERNFL